MINKKLYYQIKSKNKSREREHAKTIGTLTWGQYRELKQVWHRIPNEDEYFNYWIFCKKSNYEPEHIEYIKQAYKRK